MNDELKEILYLAKDTIDAINDGDCQSAEKTLKEIIKICQENMV